MKFWLRAEMKEKANFQFACLQIIEHLPRRGPAELGRRLCLNHDKLIDNHIQALNTEREAFVEDWNAYLAFNPVPTSQQLVLQRKHVQMLEKPVSESVVNVVESCNDRLSENSVL